MATALVDLYGGDDFERFDRIILAEGYRPSEDEEFMCGKHRAYFLHKLKDWKEAIIEESSRNPRALTPSSLVRRMRMNEAYGGPLSPRQQRSMRHIRNMFAISSLHICQFLLSLWGVTIGPCWGWPTCPVSPGKVTSNRLRLHR